MGRLGIVSAVLCVCSCLLAAGCGATMTTPPPSLDRVPWCGTPTIAFQDEGVAPSVTITDWPHAQPGLNLLPLLPPSLPKGTCLLSAGGILHDPTFGGRFIITYALPNHGALSIAETPQTVSIASVQCDTSTLGSTPLSTCQTTQGGLNITTTGTQSIPELRTLLSTLQSGVNWVPQKS